MNKLQPAIDFFGSKASLARAIDVSPMVVYQWSRRRVPAEKARLIEKVTNGAVLASELRPDVFCEENA